MLLLLLLVFAIVRFFILFEGKLVFLQLSIELLTSHLVFLELLPFVAKFHMGFLLHQTHLLVYFRHLLL